MITPSVEIEQHGDNHWTVRVGDRFCPDLTWDEMLGLVVRLTHTPGTPPYPVLPIEQHLENDRRRAERIARIDAANNQPHDADPPFIF